MSRPETNQQEPCFPQIVESATHQNSRIPRPSANGLPVYDSMEQAASACGIPLLVLKQAKRRGCPAFNSTRFYLGEFLPWHFAQGPGDTIDHGTEKARLTRAEASLAEERLRREREGVVEWSEVEKRVSETVILPLRGFFNGVPTSYDVRTNPQHPELAHAALAELVSDAKKLLRQKLPAEKSKTQNHEQT